MSAAPVSGSINMTRDVQNNDASKRTDTNKNKGSRVIKNDVNSASTVIKVKSAIPRKR